jgi:hypothetical protein
VVELNPGEETRIARNIGDHEAGQFRLRKHCNLPKERAELCRFLIGL